MKSLSRVCMAVGLVLGCGASSAAIVQVNGGGNTPQGLAPAVDSFRALLGSPIQVTWDGITDAAAAPNVFPSTYVDAVNGLVLTTPGTGFQVSADAVNPTGTLVEFGNLDPSYSALFTTYSAERLFSPLGSWIMDVTFTTPGTGTPAGVAGFGAVFSDVDLANTTSLALYDAAGALLDTFYVQPGSGDETLSFLGLFIDSGELIGRVRITLGNQALGSGALTGDLVVLDDFIYGTPRLAQVPEPGSLALVGIALALLLSSAFGRSLVPNS